MLLRRTNAAAHTSDVMEDMGVSLDASSPVWMFEGGLEVSAAAHPMPPSESLGPTVAWDLAWKVESAGWGPYDVVIVWKDRDDRVVKASVIPIGARRLPMSYWAPRHWMRQTVRVLVPRSLQPGSYRVMCMVIHEVTRQPLRLTEPSGRVREPWVPLATINAVKSHIPSHAPSAL